MPNLSPELVQASFQGDLPQVKQLLESGADVNSVDQHGMGPLLTFHPHVVEYLLSQGADPNVQTNETGASVLAGLAYMNQTECVQLLLEAGADPNLAYTPTGETSLHATLTKAHEDRSKIVQLLLDHGANPNAQTIANTPTGAFWRDVRNRGETPLHRAAAFGNVKTVESLLAAGADRRLRDANGDTPLTWASWHLRPGRILYLLSYDDTGITESMIPTVDKSHGYTSN